MIRCAIEYASKRAVQKLISIFGYSQSHAFPMDFTPFIMELVLQVFHFMGLLLSWWLLILVYWSLLALTVGFEPTDAFTSPVFKTGVIDQLYQLTNGANGGNRTRITSLEGWSSNHWTTFAHGGKWGTWTHDLAVNSRALLPAELISHLVLPVRLELTYYLLV